MCRFCLMQDDEEDEATRPKSHVPPSRNYTGPFSKTPGRLLGLGLIRFYQLTLSSLVGSNCRHLPTCSEYGYESVARHGLWHGGWMTLIRLVRCGPGGTSGFDPVASTLVSSTRWWAPWRHWSRHSELDGNESGKKSGTP